MKNNKRIISMIIVFVLMLSSFTTVFAANRDLTHKITKDTKDFPNYLLDDSFIYDLLVNDELENYYVEVGTKLYNLADVQAKFDADPTITLEEAVLGLTPVDLDELTVIEISAINSTTIRVTFSDGIESNFTVPSLSNGANTVTFTYDGVTYTGNVNWVAKASVENVVFDNYRQIRVIFNTVVDEDTAVNPYNYYFEIVEGDVAGDALGAYPTLKTHNQLKDIETAYPGWWADGHITADTSTGKTIVTINLPEDARFTNVLDNLNIVDNAADDDERTLSIILADGTTRKYLIRNTNVVVSVRNVKSADKIRNIDTSRNELLILDEKAPNLVAKHHVKGGVKTEFVKNITLLSDSSDHIEFEYDEPVFDAHDLSTLAIDRDVIVYVNGKKAASTKDGNLAGKLDFYMNYNHSYDQSRIAKLNVAAIAAAARDKDGNLAPEPFIDGETLVIRILGVTDLAGNIQVPSDVEIVVEVEDPSISTPPTTTIEKPVVLDVAQVTDNIFRVEFDQANVTGEFTIENADGENGLIEKYNLPLSTLKVVGGENKYFSYITVNAIDVDPSPYKYDNPNSAEKDILAYDDQVQLDRTIRVRNVWSVDSNKYYKQGDNFKKEMFPIVKDTLAPQIVEPVGGVYKIDFDDANVTNRQLKLSVKDILPNTWTGEYKNPVKALFYDYVAGDIDRNKVVDFGDHTNGYGANEQYLPIKVSYTKDGITHSAILANRSLPQNPKPSPGLTPIKYDYATQELTLDLSEYTSLLDNKVVPTDSELVKGVTYKVEILKGFFADPELEDIDNGGTVNFTNHPDFLSQVTWAGFNRTTDNLSTVNAGNAYGAEVMMKTPTVGGKFFNGFQVLHVSNSRTLGVGPVIGKGYSSKEQVILYEVGDEPIIPGVDPEGMVPQTSKELIKYDRDANEMSIEFKGEIDVTTLKKASNYTLNGKTLAAWGVNDNEIMFKQDKDGTGKVTAQYAIFVVPQDSVPQNGDVEIIIEGVKNLVGGTMTRVETEVFLLDNTRPVVIKAVKQGDYQILLTFDEPLEFKEFSNEFTAAKNFIVKVNGVEMLGSVLEARLVKGERKVTLQLGVDITSTLGDIVVRIVEDASNNINIIDQAKHKNPLKDGYDIPVQR